MSTPDTVATRLDAAAALLRTASRPLLFCHRSPDGDTIGAALGLAMGLRRLGRQPTVACADPLPPSLLFMPESGSPPPIIAACTTPGA